MKQNHLISISALCTLLLVVFACRKDIDNYLHDRARPASDLLESAKVWHLQHLDTDNPSLKLKPTWKDAWTMQDINGKTIVVVPAPEKPVDRNVFSIRRFLVFKSNEKGEANNGRIIELLGNGYNVEDNIDLLLKHIDQSTIPGFKGSILQYDVNYAPLHSDTYENGQMNSLLTTEIVNLARGKGSTFSVPKGSIAKPKFGVSLKASAANNCGDPQIFINGVPPGLNPECVATFSVQYVWTNGCITTINYNYQYVTCPNNGSNFFVSGSGSGSGGSGSGNSNGDSPPYGSGTDYGSLSALINFNRQIDGTELIDCMNNVLNKIKGFPGSTTVSDIIVKFSGNVPGFDWRLEMSHGDDISQVALTQPIYDTVHHRVTTYMNSNPDVIKNATDLAIAQTILHESVHAYLTTYLATEPDAAEKSYPELFDIFGVKKKQNDDQHFIFARDFVKDIAGTLKEYGKGQGYNLPDQYYNDMAWGSLTDTKAFKKLPEADRTRIINIKKSEQYGVEKEGFSQKGKKAGCKI